MAALWKGAVTRSLGETAEARSNPGAQIPHRMTAFLFAGTGENGFRAEGEFDAPQ